MRNPLNAFSSVQVASTIIWGWQYAHAGILMHSGPTFSMCGSVLSPALFPLPKLEQLYIDGGRYSELQLEELPRDDAETTRWLELFQPFSTVKNLYLSEVFAPRIAPTLEMLSGERTTEALPIL
jgi:hypothetical protein